MKQMDIHKKTGISLSMISMVISGQRAPSWGNAKLLHKVTGIPVKYWMNSIDSPDILKEQLIKKGIKK